VAILCAATPGFNHRATSRLEGQRSKDSADRIAELHRLPPSCECVGSPDWNAHVLLFNGSPFQFRNPTNPSEVLAIVRRSL
jgi:hypothetical protein